MSGHRGEPPASECRPTEANPSVAYQSSFDAEAARQSVLVTRSSFAAEDQAYVDAISELEPSKSEMKSVML